MQYDFSSKPKIDEFIAGLQKDPTTRWRDPLPDLRWIDESEFVRSHYFMYGAVAHFTRRLGGPNKDDNHAQAAPGMNPHHATYARCMLMHDLKGFVLVPDYHHTRDKGKLHIGTFAFCRHANTDHKRLGNCWNRYRCRDCGYTWEIDSSD